MRMNFVFLSLSQILEEKGFDLRVKTEIRLDFIFSMIFLFSKTLSFYQSTFYDFEENITVKIKSYKCINPCIKFKVATF